MDATEEANNEFEKEYKVMSVFIENAKTYVQLSAGALLLSVTFLHEILGIPKEQRVATDNWLMLSGGGSFLRSFVAHCTSIMRRSSWSGSPVSREATVIGRNG